MAELKQAPVRDCCPAEAQADCCDPTEKSKCCSPGFSSCDCSVGKAHDVEDVREAVRARYASAAPPAVAESLIPPDREDTKPGRHQAHG